MGAVWLVASAGASVGLPGIVWAAFAGGVAGLVLMAVVVLVGGMALLVGVGAMTSSATAMTADPDRRVWWAVLVEGVGAVALFALRPLIFTTGAGMPLWIFLSGIPFAVVAAVLALLPGNRPT
ncbi:hypothetical protein GCM10022247_53190 [Allokutzneria multivorans]|uniref:Uncharacterized protein n=1 Tax=Allokutzneria multivorans TaxID=1142134 RepID=A0ABP7T7V7_9PSEU